MTRPTSVYIDSQALVDNLQAVKMYAPRSKIVAVVKANAYGHGLTTVAAALAPYADLFAVACIDEALVIRKANIQTPILLLEGLFASDELTCAAENNFIPVIHNTAQLELILQQPSVTWQQVWLKVNLGMHRLGVAPEEVEAIWRQIHTSISSKNPPVLMGHLPDADNLDSLVTAAQITQFKQLSQALNAKTSLANSAGILAWPEAHTDYVRPGIMLYGVSPLIEQPRQLKPVMHFKTQLMALRQTVVGDRIGYGGDYLCTKPMRIGLIAAGYGDGYPRHITSGSMVLIHNRLAPIVGRVSMDMMTVDLTAHSEAKIGDEVTLWGKGLRIETIAQQAGTIAYELLCQVTARPKIFKV